MVAVIKAPVHSISLPPNLTVLKVCWCTWTNMVGTRMFQSGRLWQSDTLQAHIMGPRKSAAASRAICFSSSFLPSHSLDHFILFYPCQPHLAWIFGIFLATDPYLYVTCNWSIEPCFPLNHECAITDHNLSQKGLCMYNSSLTTSLPDCRLPSNDSEAIPGVPCPADALQMCHVKRHLPSRPFLPSSAVKKPIPASSIGTNLWLAFQSSPQPIPSILFLGFTEGESGRIQDWCGNHHLLCGSLLARLPMTTTRCCSGMTSRCQDWAWYPIRTKTALQNVAHHSVRALIWSSTGQRTNSMSDRRAFDGFRT